MSTQQSEKVEFFLHWGSFRSLHQLDHQIFAFEGVADFDEDFLHGAVAGGCDGGEHFHRLEGEQGVAFFDFVTDADGKTRDHAGHGGGDLIGIGGVAFGPRGAGLDGALVVDLHVAWVAIEFENRSALTGGINFGDVVQADEQGFSSFETERDFLFVLEPVEKRGGRQDGEVAEIFARFDEVFVNLGIHQVRVKLVIARGFVAGDFGNLDACFFEIDFFRAFARAIREGLFVAEDDFLDVLGPAAHRLAEAALEHVDNALGEVCACRQALQVAVGIAGFDAAGDEEHAHVADNFGRRCDFDDVAEE